MLVSLNMPVHAVPPGPSCGAGKHQTRPSTGEWAGV
jgi:hypothetical protein